MQGIFQGEQGGVTPWGLDPHRDLWPLQEEDEGTAGCPWAWLGAEAVGVGASPRLQKHRIKSPSRCASPDAAEVEEDVYKCNVHKVSALETCACKRLF